MNGQINMMGSIEHYVTQHSPPQLTTQHNSGFWLLCYVLGLCKRWHFCDTILYCVGATWWRR